MDLSRKIAVVTGVTDGMGVPLVRRLASAGVTLVVLARDEVKARAVIAGLNPGSKTHLVLCDLASLDQIRVACEQIRSIVPHIDVIINNAGLMKRRCEFSPDGFELSIAVNHLAVHALNIRLLDLLRAGRGRGRIVNVNSEGHRASLGGGAVTVEPRLWRSDDPEYNVFMAYSRAKLANLMTTYVLAGRLDGIMVNALHPGVIRTRLGRELSSMVTGAFHLAFSSTPETGAESILRLATDESLEHVTGAYFNKDCRERSSELSLDKDQQARIWRATVDATGLDLPTT